MTNQRLSILVIASWYPSVESPTAGTFVQEQVQMLSSYGHKVTVVHPYMLGTFVRSLFKLSCDSFAQENGVRILRVGVTPLLPFFRSFSYHYCFRRVLLAGKKHSINFREFDVVHSHASFMGGIIANLLFKKYRLPFVHTEHTSGLIFNTSQYTSMDLASVINLYQNARNVLFVSLFAKNRILSNLKLESTVNVSVVSNLVNDSFFDSPLSQHKQPTKLFMVADFIPRKNYSLLIEAWKIVKIQFPTLELTLVGDGIEKATFIDRCMELNLNGIHFLPRLIRTSLELIMQEQHIVLSTSMVETFGLSIAEAQALGLPAVVTNSGGVRDIITQETGIITEPNAKAFAEGIIQMIDMYDKFDALRIRQIAKDRFSSEVIMNQLNSVYQRVQ